MYLLCRRRDSRRLRDIFQGTLGCAAGLLCAPICSWQQRADPTPEKVPSDGDSESTLGWDSRWETTLGWDSKGLFQRLLQLSQNRFLLRGYGTDTQHAARHACESHRAAHDGPSKAVTFGLCQF